MDNQVSIDWCDDTIKRELPWDSTQYVTVKRFSGRDKRRRQALAATYRIGPEKSEEMELQMAYDKLKEFEWSTAITDFRLKDSRGKIYSFADAKKNMEIFDHIGGKVEEFIDELILEVNKEDSTEVVSAEVKEVEGNLESLSDES